VDGGFGADSGELKKEKAQARAEARRNFSRGAAGSATAGASREGRGETHRNTEKSHKSQKLMGPRKESLSQTVVFLNRRGAKDEVASTSWGGGRCTKPASRHRPYDSATVAAGGRKEKKNGGQMFCLLQREQKKGPADLKKWHAQHHVHGHDRAPGRL